jgi:hypothetical protein
MASILKVDTITGVATAGSIAITGEGNSTTTNLQQGLAKGWFHYDGSGSTFADSFNGSSATDRGTGSYDMNFTNNMSSDNYSCYGATMAGGNRLFGGSGDGTPGINTSNFNTQIYEHNTIADSTHILSAMHGDLA